MYVVLSCSFARDGGFVAGQTDKHRDSEALYLLYKVMLLVWIVFGLGYLVMILGFITSAMQSKKMARIERKLANNIKQTHSKLWNTFTRDVSYLRRVLNEMYVMTLKVTTKVDTASLIDCKKSLPDAEIRYFIAGLQRRGGGRLHHTHAQ